MHDADDDELRRTARRQSDLGADLTPFALLLRIGLGVTFDIESFFLRGAGQRAIPPEPCQIDRQLALNPDPQPRFVRLERRPGHVLVYPSAQRQEQPAHVDIPPLRLAAESASPPDANASARKSAQTIDACGIELILQSRVHQDSRSCLPFADAYVHGAVHNFVGRRFKDASSGARASIDAGYVAGGWNKPVPRRAGDFDPWIVERAVDR